MTTTQIISRLLQLPGEIAAAESRVHHYAECITAAKNTLKDAEATHLLSGTVPGKNAEERAAHLRMVTARQRAELDYMEQQEGIAKLALSALQTELSCLRTVARLIARETD